jgi:DNA-binding Xre family transcriptional regulator
MDVQAIGSHITARARWLGVSYAEIARRARISEATVHKIRTGKVPAPRADTLSAISVALGQPHDTLERVGAGETVDTDEPTTSAVAELAQLQRDVQEIKQILQDVRDRLGL